MNMNAHEKAIELIKVIHLAASIASLMLLLFFLIPIAFKCCKIYKETAMLEQKVYKMYIEDREDLKKD